MLFLFARGRGSLRICLVLRLWPHMGAMAIRAKKLCDPFVMELQEVAK